MNFKDLLSMMHTKDTRPTPISELVMLDSVPMLDTSKATTGKRPSNSGHRNSSNSTGDKKEYESVLAGKTALAKVRVQILSSYALNSLLFAFLSTLY
jgi:hypothetical protein